MHSIVYIAPAIVYVLNIVFQKQQGRVCSIVAKLFEVKLKYSDNRKLRKRENKNTKIFGWTKVSFRVYVRCLVVTKKECEKEI